MIGPRRVIDLNADLGESFGAWRLGDDEALLQVVTSANLACGFHAGDPLTIRRARAMAGAGGGAHGGPGLLPGPGGVRPPGDDRPGRGTGSRDPVPDRRR